MPHFFCLLVVNTDDVVLARRAEGRTVQSVVDGHNVVALFVVVVDLLARLGSVLVQVTVGVGHQQDGSCGAAHLVQRTPPETVDRTRVFAPRWDLGNFVVSAEVEHPDTPVTVAASRHGVLLIEACHHHFCVFGDDRLHKHLVLEGNLLCDSK